MPGEAIVTTGESQWTVSLATTPAEWAQGLSNVPSMPAGTGMLFDLGTDQVIIVNTLAMLFDLDIIWIHSTSGVADVARSMKPGYDEILPNALARYFLEVNAGEAEDVQVGDQVLIEALWANGEETSDLSTVVGMVTQLAIFGMTLGLLSKVTRRTLAPRQERSRLYGPRGELLAQTGSSASARFIGGCRVADGVCTLHGQPVEQDRWCPSSDLTDQEWRMVWEMAQDAWPQGDLWPATASPSEAPPVERSWPDTLQEAYAAVASYARHMRAGVERYRARMRQALENYERSVERAIDSYQHYVLGEYERRRQTSATPITADPGEREEIPAGIEFFADSREQILASTDPHRQKMDQAFREAIERVRTGLSFIKMARELGL